MTTIARLIAPLSGLRDMARDWQRWTTGERMGAVIIMAFVIAMPAAVWIAAHSA